MQNIFSHPMQIIQQIMIARSLNKLLLILCVSIRASKVLAYSTGAGACPGGEAVSTKLAIGGFSLIFLSFLSFQNCALGGWRISLIE
jgi:hypothetical protein